MWYKDTAVQCEKANQSRSEIDPVDLSYKGAAAVS